MSHLPTLAGHPTSRFLPIRRDLDGVFLQLLPVGMDGYTEPGKLHYGVKVARHAGSRCELGRCRESDERKVVDVGPVPREMTVPQGFIRSL